MDVEEAHKRNLITDKKKKQIDNKVVASFLLVFVATMFVALYFGIGAASSALVAARHAEFHAVVGVVNDKGALLGGPQEGDGELLDHYRLRVRFQDSLGVVHNPPEAISWQLGERPTVKVYDGPGHTFDIPSAIEGTHPRHRSLFWLWFGGALVSLVLGIVLAFVIASWVEQALLRPCLRKTQRNGPVPAT